MTPIITIRNQLWYSVGGGSVVLAAAAYADGTSVTYREGDPLPEGVAEYLEAGGEVVPLPVEDQCRDVDRVRDELIAAGIEYPPGSGRTIQTRPVDQENITQQMLRAVAVKDSPEAWGDGRVWLDLSNTDPLPLPSPQSMIDLATAIGDRKEALIFRAHVIKARIRAGEVVEYTDPAEWP